MIFRRDGERKRRRCGAFPASPVIWAVMLAAVPLFCSCRTAESPGGGVPAKGRMVAVNRNDWKLKNASREAVLQGNLVYMRSPAAADGNGRIYIDEAEAAFLRSPLARCGKAVKKASDVLIFIDPGHGGRENGAVGRLFREKDLNLKFALELEKHLKRQGFRVMLSRRRDQTLGLDERAAMAGRAGAALFISIHHNAGKNPASRGLEAYSLTPEGFGSTNTPEALSDKVHPGSAVQGQSRVFAYLCMKHINRTKTGIDRGVRYARFRVLAESSCPSVLLELGFVSSPEEERALDMKERREKLCRAVAAAVLENFSLAPAAE